MDHLTERPAERTDLKPPSATNGRPHLQEFRGQEFRVPSVESSPRGAADSPVPPAQPATALAETEQAPKTRAIPLVQISDVTLNFDNDMSMPISVSSTRFHRPESINPSHLAIATGSTATRLHSGTVRTAPRVVTKVSYVNDGQTVGGFILAIASGDDASSICDEAIRLMSQVADPARLNSGILSRIASSCSPLVALTTDASAPPPQLSTSLACVRVYPVGTDLFQVHGFNVGSNVILEINPVSREVRQLLIARAVLPEDHARREGHLTRPAPAIIQDFNPVELVEVHEQITADSLLVAMSAEVYSHLDQPRTRTVRPDVTGGEDEEAEPKALYSYLESDVEQISDEFLRVSRDTTSVESYADQLLQSAVVAAENHRLRTMRRFTQRLEAGNLDVEQHQDFSIGGDLALAVARVSAEACQNALRHRLMVVADDEFAVLRAKVAEYKTKPDEKLYAVISDKFNEVASIYRDLNHIPGLLRVGDFSLSFANFLIETFSKFKNPSYPDKIMALFKTADDVFKHINYKQGQLSVAKAATFLAVLLFERYFQTSDQKFADPAEGLLVATSSVFERLDDRDQLRDVANIYVNNVAHYFVQYLKTRNEKHCEAALKARQFAVSTYRTLDPSLTNAIAKADLERGTKLFSTYLIDSKAGEFPRHAFDILRLAEREFRENHHDDGLKQIAALYYNFAVQYGQKYVDNIDTDAYFNIGVECLGRACHLASENKDEAMTKQLIQRHIELANALASLFHDSLDPKYAQQAKYALENLLAFLPVNDHATRKLIAETYLDLAADLRHAYANKPAQRILEGVGTEAAVPKPLDEYADELLARADAIFGRSDDRIGQIRVCFQQGDLGLARHAAELKETTGFASTLFGSKKPVEDKRDPRVIILIKADEIYQHWQLLYDTAEYKNFVLQGLFCEQVLDYLVNTVEFLTEKCKKPGYNPTRDAAFDVDAAITKYLEAIVAVYENIIERCSTDIIDSNFANRTNLAYLKAMEEFFTHMSGKLQQHIPETVETNKELAGVIATELRSQQAGLKPPAPAAKVNCLVM